MLLYNCILVVLPEHRESLTHLDWPQHMLLQLTSAYFIQLANGLCVWSVEKKQLCRQSRSLSGKPELDSLV